MKVGSIVECINNQGIKNSYPNENTVIPKLEVLYTVREIEDYEGKTGIKLEEIVNGYGFYRKPGSNTLEFCEPSYKIERFREVMPPEECTISEVKALLKRKEMHVEQ